MNYVPGGLNVQRTLIAGAIALFGLAAVPVYAMSYFTDDGAAHGFLYTNGNYSTFTELNVPGAGSTQAFGISNNGLVVGQAIESSGDLGFTYDISTNQYDTFTLPGLPSGATFVPFGINNAGEVVGTYSSPSGEFSVFLYTPGSSSYTLLPENPAAVIGFFEGTFGVGIDDAGDLAGNYSVDGSLGFGFLPYVYLDGTYANFNVNLPSADVYNSGADGINNLGACPSNAKVELRAQDIVLLSNAVYCV